MSVDWTAQYHQDIKINRGQLDVECANQSDLYLKYAEMKSDADRKVNIALKHLDIGVAELYSSIKSEMHEDLGKAPTEKAVDAKVKVNKRYLRLNDHYSEAKIEAKKLDLVLTAFGQRKSMLEQLVKLHGNSYFSEPVTTGTSVDTYENDRKAVVGRKPRKRRNAEE